VKGIIDTTDSREGRRIDGERRFIYYRGRGAGIRGINNMTTLNEILIV